MPEMDGFEFLAEMQRHEQWRSIPVMVVTARDLSPEDRMFLNGSMMLGGSARRLLQKGQFNREDLLREVWRDLLAPRAQVAAAKHSAGTFIIFRPLYSWDRRLAGRGDDLPARCRCHRTERVTQWMLITFRPL